MNIVCPSLPCALQIKQELRNKWKQQIVAILEQCTVRTRQTNSFPDPQLLQGILATIPNHSQAEVCSEILFDLLASAVAAPSPDAPTGLPLNASNQLSFELEVKISILILLKLCPDAAKVGNASGNLLIHFISLMELPDRDLMRFLCHAYPLSISMYFQTPDQGRITPFHCILLKSEVDFELALFMALLVPKVARDEFGDGKYPLHLVMNSVSVDDVSFNSSVDFQIKLIKKLLTEYPTAAFTEVVEEVRYLRLSGLQTTNEAASNAANNSQSFQMQVQIRKWTPVERAHQSSDSKMKSIFHKFVEHVGMKRLQSQIRRF